MNKLRVYLRGAYGVGNFGDDALAVASCSVLGRLFGRHSLISCDQGAGYLNKLLPETCKVRERKQQHEYDYLIYGGGTQFFSFPLTESTRISRLVKRGLRLATSPKQSFARVRFGPKGCKKAALGVGVGPFVKNSTAERRTRKLFRELDFVAVRDAASLSLCKDWGVEHAFQGADLCFLPSLWKVGTPQIGRQMGVGKSLGVVVRDWPHTKEGAAYGGPLLDAVSQLRKGGFSVRFIAFCRKADHDWMRSLQRRGEEPLLWNPEESDVAEFLGQMSTFDCLLSARYHGAVFAAILGKPTVCIEVEQKLALVARLLGVGGRLWKQPFDRAKCVALVHEVLDHASNATKALRHAVVEQEKLASQMVDRFQAYLSGTRTEPSDATEADTGIRPARC